MSKLRALMPHLEKLLGSFRWKVMSQEEVKKRGLLDPACAVLRGQMGPFTIDIHADGEWSTAFHSKEDTTDAWVMPVRFDLTKKPSVVATEIVNMLRSWEPE